MAIDFNADQNRLGLAMLAAAGPSRTPMSFGQRLFAGMGQHDQYLQEKEQREQLRKAREAQLAFQQMQMVQMVQEQAQRKAAQEREDAIDGAYRGAIRTPQQQALSQFGGPTRAAAQAMPGMIPQIDQQALIESLAKVDPRTAFQMLAPKPRKLTTVAPGASLVDESDPTKPVFTAPDRPKEINPNQPFMMIDGKITPNPAYQQYEMAKAQAGRTSVNVNTAADKTFENETALRKEFNTLPEVVGYKAAIPAFKAVQDAATRLTPQSDINIIYGIAKLYDPTSVVREGEYATIANSQAIPERIKSLAQQIQGKGKLTPETRAQLMVEARQRIGTLQGEYTGAKSTYEGIAKKRQLDTGNVFAPVGQGIENKPTQPAGGIDMNAIEEELRRRQRTGGW
jgi:hypothetical protein